MQFATKWATMVPGIDHTEVPGLGLDETTRLALAEDVRAEPRRRRGPHAGTRPRGRHTYLVHPGAVEGLAAVVEQRWVSRPEVLEVALTELLSWFDAPASRERAEELLATLPAAPDGGQGKVVAIDTYADTRERLADAARQLRVSMNRVVNLAIVALVAGAAPPARGRLIQLGKPSSRIEPALERRLREAMRSVLDGRHSAAALIARLPAPPPGT